MRLMPVVLGIVPILFVGGCMYLAHMDELLFLKGLGDNAREIQQYIDAQHDSFIKLRDDVKNNRLVMGLSKEEVIAAYGDPVYCKAVTENSTVAESCLYRLPTHYFATDMIYLRFDKGQKLCGEEFLPADGKK